MGYPHSYQADITTGPQKPGSPGSRTLNNITTEMNIGGWVPFPSYGVRDGKGDAKNRAEKE